MKRMSVLRSALIFIFMAVSSVSAQEPVYWDVVQKITEESFEHNEIMENASWLTDVFGPRNAKSPGYIAAANWVKKRLEEYGLSNARLDPYEFGVGYVNEFISVHMTAPRYMPIVAYPATWSAGTDGEVKGPVVYINFDEITSEAELEQYRGKLRNAIVFTRPKQDITHRFSPLEERFTDERLDELSKITIGPRVTEDPPDRSAEKDKLSRQQIIDFVFGEGCAAIVRTDGQSDYGYGGLIVLIRETGLRAIIESGTSIEAKVSDALLVSLFSPRSLLHDGAVIINHDRIEAAKCLLPLSQNPHLDKKLGTRHRACIGITEESDAIVIIVSEETGKISVAQNGKIQTDFDYERLYTYLIRAFNSA